jgi:hypothetical protein
MQLRRYEDFTERYQLAVSTLDQVVYDATPTIE